MRELFEGVREFSWLTLGILGFTLWMCIIAAFVIFWSWFVEYRDKS